MIALLRIESVGDDIHWRSGRLVAARGTIPHGLRGIAHYLAADRPWVARIKGIDARFGLAREFLASRKDFAGSNGSGSRGVILHYELRPGLYEVNERVSWRRNERYFVRSLGGRIERVEEEEVVREAKRSTR